MAGIMCASCFLFSSCSGKTEGYFIWEYVNSNQAEIRIRDLTEEGKKQDFLEFPAYIKNKPVTTFGKRTPLGAVRKISCEAKVIYLPETTAKIEGPLFANCKNIQELYILSTKKININLNTIGVGNAVKGGKYNGIVVVPKIGENNLNGTFMQWMKARVTFFYNFENSPNNDVFWIIGYPSNLYQPKEPQREGYIFNGWYEEKECVNPFNFNIKYDEDENRYLDIFAGWVKI